MEFEEMLNRRFKVSLIALGIFLPIALFFFFQYLFFNAFANANIHVDVTKVVSPLYQNWSAISQGGEEVGARMLHDVIPQLSTIHPRYIRIDHMYDFYDVVNRDQNGGLIYNWSRLDDTVCDIYATGAKPFFVLGYMPPALSSDGTLIGAPQHWDEWAQVVQKTIERYSGTHTNICGGTTGNQLSKIYYEVWNEPDLESFGAWTMSGGKDYRTLYQYSSIGAQKAQDVQPFLLGGPATTGAYQNWFQKFLNYAVDNGLRLDFISWHHYTDQPDDFIDDVQKINSWLPPEAYERYYNLPKVISEWGYDTNYNPVMDSTIGAAYSVAVIRNLIDQKVDLAFTFEAKDGKTPSHGILKNNGEKKPRYDALQLLNKLEGYRIKVDGEGSYVRAIASRSNAKTTVVLANYDKEDKHSELVPVSISGLPEGVYRLVISNINGATLITLNIPIHANTDFERSIEMLPNHVAVIELFREQ